MNSFKRLLTLFLTLLLVPLAVTGGSSARVICIDIDGSMTIEPAESPCCGRCCTNHPSDTNCDQNPVLSEPSPADECIDVPLPGSSTVTQGIRVPPMRATVAYAPLPDLIPPYLGPSFLPSSAAIFMREGGDSAGSARIAQLATVIIRC
jgi:hypothetical protein